MRPEPYPTGPPAKTRPGPRLALWGALAALALTLGCGPTPRPRPPAPPRDWTPDCRDIFAQDYRRAPTAEELAFCVGQFRLPGATDPRVRAAIYARYPRPTPPPPPATMRGRLHVHGRAMHYPDHARFPWRGLMAFRLLDLVADGRDADAAAYLDWAAREGFTVLRVLAMNYGWMDLRPEDGRRALPALLERAGARGLYVQVVALAGTGKGGSGWGERAFLEAQVRAVGQACAAVENCVLEIANEPYHATQAGRVHDVGTLRALRRLVPAAVPVALGASQADEGPEAEALAQGADFVVLHLDRSRDRWNRVRRVRELEMVSSRAKTYVVDNEPTGAAERAEGGRRDDEPAAFYGQGVLSRVFGVGSTFHCSDCLEARVPGPVQRRCAQAFVAGARFWPDAAALRFANAGWPDSPIAGANFDRVVRAYSATDGARWWTVLLGVTGDPGLKFRDGYRRGATAEDRGALQVIEVAR